MVENELKTDSLLESWSKNTQDESSTFIVFLHKTCIFQTRKQMPLNLKWLLSPILISASHQMNLEVLPVNLLRVKINNQKKSLNDPFHGHITAIANIARKVIGVIHLAL